MIRYEIIEGEGCLLAISREMRIGKGDMYVSLVEDEGYLELYKGIRSYGPNEQDNYDYDFEDSFKVVGYLETTGIARGYKKKLSGIMQLLPIPPRKIDVKKTIEEQKIEIDEKFLPLNVNFYYGFILGFRAASKNNTSVPKYFETDLEIVDERLKGEYIYD